MYAETRLLFSYIHNFSREVQPLDDFFSCIHKSNASSNDLVQTSTMFEYDLGGEGDLFKAPEPIIEEPSMGIDPMAAAISMISFGDNVASPQTMDVVDIESIQSEQLLSEVLYECEKDLLEKSAIEEPLTEIPDIKIPGVCMEVDPISDKDGTNQESSFQKSVSSGCLGSMEWIREGPLRSNFLEDFRIPYGMRRAYSEGDMQTLGNGHASIIRSPLKFERTMTIGNCTIEERREKLTRYWKKKTKRNFGRKIKYACRKALADSQPRVRGRFAKTEASDISKKISV